MSQGGAFTSAIDGSGNVMALQGNSGGRVGPNGTGLINVVGSGNIIIAGNPGTHTLTASYAGNPVTWNLITVNTTETATPNNGYAVINGNLVLSLPLLTPNIGDIIQVGKLQFGSWTINLSGGQVVFMGNKIINETISSTDIGDNITLVALDVGALWMATSVIGNPAYTTTF